MKVSIKVSAAGFFQAVLGIICTITVLVLALNEVNEEEKWNAFAAENHCEILYVDQQLGAAYLCDDGALHRHKR